MANNSLFQMMTGGQLPGPAGGFQRLVQQFQQFKQNFHGDPKAEVEKMLQSGKLNQQQLDQIQAMAKQFEILMK